MLRYQDDVPTGMAKKLMLASPTLVIRVAIWQHWAIAKSRSETSHPQQIGTARILNKYFLCPQESSQNVVDCICIFGK